VKRLFEDAHDVLGARDDGSGCLVTARQVSTMGVFLKGVGADDRGADLAGDGDERRRVELGVGEGGDEVGGAGSRGGDADADLAGGAGITLGRENRRPARGAAGWCAADR